MSRKLLVLAALAVLAACAGWLRADEAAAQSTTCKTLVPRCVNQAPFVTLNPPTGTAHSPYMAVTVTVNDESGIKPASFLVKLNGTVIQSGGATAGATYAVNMGLTLVPGQNVLEVSVCDTADLCGADEGIYWYVVQPPADSFAVATVDLEPYHDGIRATSPFDASAMYATPAYVSQDVPRSVSLVYDGARRRRAR